MNNYMTKSMGLQGSDDYSDEPWYGDLNTPAETDSGKTGGGFTNTVNAIANLFSSATNAITKITTQGGGGQVTYTPPAGSGAPPAPSFLQQHGGKLLLGGLALGAGILTVRALSKKKKK